MSEYIVKRFITYVFKVEAVDEEDALDRKRSTAPPCQAPSYAMAGALIGSNSSIRL